MVATDRNNCVKRDTWNVSEDKKDIIQVLSVLHEIFEQKPNLEAKEKEDYQVYRRRKNREVLRQNNGDPKELQNILESMSFSHQLQAIPVHRQA